jgi:hypothetical protein
VVVESFDRIRTCDIRFRNGWSVADCVQRLTCCFVLIAGGRTRGHFASASRFASTNLEDCFGGPSEARSVARPVTGPAVDRTV